MAATFPALSLSHSNFDISLLRTGSRGSKGRTGPVKDLEPGLLKSWNLFKRTIKKKRDYLMSERDLKL